MIVLATYYGFIIPEFLSQISSSTNHLYTIKLKQNVSHQFITMDEIEVFEVELESTDYAECCFLLDLATHIGFWSLQFVLAI